MQNLKNEQGSFIVGLLFVILLFSGVFYLVPQYTVAHLAKFLIVDEEPKAADVIVILLNPGVPSRTVKAAKLYQQGLAPRIVIAEGFDPLGDSRGYPASLVWPRSSWVNVEGLKSLGVPESKILLAPGDQAYDTSSELAAVADFIKRRGWATAILVTNKSHSFRTDWIWSRVAPDVINYTVASSQPGFERWWEDGRHIKTIAYEYMALVKESAKQIRARFN